MTAKTVLVTGGSGFIGGMTCKYLVEAGHNVINLDRSKKDAPAGVTTYPFDISNHQVRGIFEVTKPDTVIHLAGINGVAQSFKDPVLFYENNVVNSITLLDTALTTGVKNFIFGSSASVYGGSEDPRPELSTCHDKMIPSDPYGRSKMMVEQVILDYQEAYGHLMNFARMRYFNAAGASPDCDWGQDKDFIVTRICKAIANGDTEFPVYKTGFARDYTHVADIAIANYMAMNYLADGGESGVFNVGRGVNTSVQDLVKFAADALEADIEPVLVDDVRTGDFFMAAADTKNAQELLGWQPQYGIDDMFKHAYAWVTK